jgi:hypothetical protein
LTEFPFSDPLLVQSEVGLVSITGTPETPSKVGLSIHLGSGRKALRRAGSSPTFKPAPRMRQV